MHCWDVATILLSLMPKKTSERGNPPNTIAKRYKLRTSTARAIAKLAPIHGSQGRALQLGAELLTRRETPIKLPAAESPMIGQTYKLTPRTIKLIDKLADKYGTRGNVLAACAQILKS